MSTTVFEQLGNILGSIHGQVNSSEGFSFDGSKFSNEVFPADLQSLVPLRYYPGPNVVEIGQYSKDMAGVLLLLATNYDAVLSLVRWWVQQGYNPDTVQVPNVAFDNINNALNNLNQ
jgi:hypothetical protein